MEGLKKEKILITGGAGFLGGHLTRLLLSYTPKIIVVDNLVKKDSLFKLEKLHRRVRLEKVDIRNKNNITNIITETRPSYIIHLAAEPIVERAFENPYDTFTTNIMGTVNIMEAARGLKQIKGIIVASSDKAYGKTKTTYTEESPLQGDHPYDVSKSCEDLISISYYKTYGLPVAVTRFGNIYGEGDLYLNRIIPGICEAVAKKKTLQIRSDGSYVRDYLYVKDVAEGYMALLNNMEKVKGEAFNFSSADTYSVLDLVKKSEIILGVKIPYKILNTAKNEIPYQHLNDRKVRALGWKAHSKLEKTLPNIFEWYSSHIFNK